jgi:signal transduction histidine kinase
MKKDTGRLRFVLLEDDPNDAELIQLQLAKDGIDVDWRHVVAERDFREALAGAPPDLVLADYTLPGFDGLAALKILLQHSPDIPFIFVSGSLGEERAIEALKSGATDYVLKDRLQRLPAVVMRALLEAKERRERREAQSATTMRTGRALTDQERAWISTDGSVRWFNYTHVPLRDHGTVSGLVCTVQEVTTRRELEQEILEISNREQRRLGSDLHDGLGQELTGLSLLLKGLEVQLSREAPQYTSHITKITDLLAHAIQSTRSLARGLAPVNLERGGLPEALKHLAARCTDMYSLQCTFGNGSPKLPDLEEGAATHLYRIAQEATTNAARYARAKTIAIDLRSTGRKLQLSIADDGIGLSAGLAQRRPGMGLKIMEYRARMLGGTINFEEPNPGTRIVLSAPLHLLRQSKEKLSRAV